MKYIALPGLLLVCLLQWIVPSAIIWTKEQVLSKGKTFKFETAPVDPDDPFRGRYIFLSFRENEFEVDSSMQVESRDEIFVSIKTGSDGFAKIRAVSKRKPASGNDYVKAKVSYSTVDSGGRRIYIDYPFDKFYMDEYKAPKAEKVYRDAGRSSEKKAYALVTILNGTAVIKDVMIDDISIGKYPVASP